MNRTFVKRIVPNLVMLSLAGFAFYQSRQFEVGMENGGVGPDLWPKIICVVLALTSILGLLTAIFAVEASAGDRDEAAEGLPAVPETHPWLVWIGVAAIGAYVWALPELGFLCATTIFAMVLLVIGGMRRWILVPFVGIALAIVFTIIFMKIVYVALPLGEGLFKAVSLFAFRLLGIH